LCGELVVILNQARTLDGISGLVVYINTTMFLALYIPLSLSSLFIYLFQLKLLTRAAGVMQLHAPQLPLAFARDLCHISNRCKLNHDLCTAHYVDMG